MSQDQVQAAPAKLVVIDAGELRLAGHLAELAALGSAEEHGTRAKVNELRAANESSVMAKGIFNWAARESHERGEAK